ncbi:DUF4190 domain-containing protein [Spelaeicoccus albus]|uniref:DUF4190 domain-containing protein n=1 Tax=Spelaeicoccus albus TaxID=1280376 RepID=A0A7Z0AAZ2_9MICO|nr:DUF4190 domain-containing protein [Spelaeicoccus albus]NYI65856.1 hypothetical protein [Spelaeicoccus albus]
MSNQYPPPDPQNGPQYVPPPPPQYGQPAPPPAPYGYQPVYGYVPAPPTNTMAVVSLVSSLATLVVGIGWIPGIICGHMAVRQIQRTGEAGEGMARAGLIIGYVFGIITVLVILAYILFFVFILGMAGLASTTSSGQGV